MKIGGGQKFPLGKGHWEIISKLMKMSIFNCQFIISIPFKKSSWRIPLLLCKRAKCQFGCPRSAFLRKERSLFSLTIAFIIWLHTISLTHGTCWSMYGAWRCSRKLPLPTCLVDRRKEPNNTLILRASERINEKYQTSFLSGVSPAYNQVLKKERKIMGLRGSSFTPAGIC